MPANDVDDLGGPAEHEWPSTLDAASVRAWIASVLSGSPQVLGPVEILQAKEWGVTARFIAVPSASSGAVTPQEIVFKASWLRLFAQAPAVYDLLARHCPGRVPDLLASIRSGDVTWSLFAAFDGPTVATVGRRESLLDLARALAHIQTAVAIAPDAEKHQLPRTAVTMLPMMFDAVLRDVRVRHASFWRGPDGRPLAEHFHIPADPVAALEAHRPHILHWTAELHAGGWPESIDHVDLHWENAVLQSGGQMLIYDWEEAGMSCPFFSLDRLLDDAREFDGLDESGPIPSPTERALRAAYLHALPWQTPDRRERALDLALCLAPIKTAYEGMLLAEALDWEEGMPNVTAWALGRAFPRWSTMAGADHPARSSL